MTLYKVLGGTGRGTVKTVDAPCRWSGVGCNVVYVV